MTHYKRKSSERDAARPDSIATKLYNARMKTLAENGIDPWPRGQMASWLSQKISFHIETVKYTNWEYGRYKPRKEHIQSILDALSELPEFDREAAYRNMSPLQKLEERVSEIEKKLEEKIA